MEASELLLEQAASIKARHSLPLADAWITAAVQQVGATLLHKDPEFCSIADLPQEWLGLSPEELARQLPRPMSISCQLLPSIYRSKQDFLASRPPWGRLLHMFN